MSILRLSSSSLPASPLYTVVPITPACRLLCCILSLQVETTVQTPSPLLSSQSQMRPTENLGSCGSPLAKAPFTCELFSPWDGFLNLLTSRPLSPTPRATRSCLCGGPSHPYRSSCACDKYGTGASAGEKQQQELINS